MSIRKQAGFAAVEAVLVIVVLAVIGVVVLKVASAKSKPVATQPISAPKAMAKDDKILVSSQQEIEQENLDDSTPDEAALDAELATF